MWFLWAALAVVVVAAAAWAVARANREARAAQSKWEEERRAHAITPADLRQTIEVLIACPPHAEDLCAGTLFSVFDGADVPARVRARVLHHVDADVDDAVGPEHLANDVLALYELRCGRTGATSFSDRIEVAVRHAERRLSDVAALAELHAAREGPAARFALVLAPGVVLERGWDRLALGMLRRCRRRHLASVLTGPPTPRHAVTGLLAADAPMFAVVQLERGYPTTKAQPFAARRPARCFETPLWEPSLAFAPMAMLDAVPFADDCPEAAQYNHSARCVAAGWRFFLPDARLAVETEGARGDPPDPATPEAHRRLAAARRRSVADAQPLRDHAHVAAGWVGRRAAAGIVSAEPEEAIAKFGKTDILKLLAPTPQPPSIP